METATLLSKLNQIAPAFIVEKQQFGRAGAGDPGELMSVWVEVKKVLPFARILRDEATLRMTWLENFSVMQLDEALVLSYFVRSHKTDARLVFRASIAPDSDLDWVEVDSVAEVWPMAREFELEIRDLFGVRFHDPIEELAARGRNLLPLNWHGFPLRKGYVFPTEVDGVAHTAPMRLDPNGEIP